MSPGSERELYADKGSVVCFKLIFSDGFFFVVVFFLTNHQAKVEIADTQRFEQG